MGSLRGWLQVSFSEKRLRLCPWQEWYVIWNCQNSIDELATFFDRYLNNKQNGWENTPRVRTTILRFNKDPLYNITEADYPIPRTEYRKMYFQNDSRLGFENPSSLARVLYNSEKYQDCAAFTYTFPMQTRLAGIPKAVLYMSCPDFHDMDVYVLLRKLDAQGNALLSLNIPWSSVAEHGVTPDTLDKVSRHDMTNFMFHVGSLGILRASRRAIDDSKSIHDDFSFHPHDRDDYITPGDTVRLEIASRPWEYSMKLVRASGLKCMETIRSSGANLYLITSLQGLRRMGHMFLILEEILLRMLYCLSCNFFSTRTF